MSTSDTMMDMSTAYTAIAFPQPRLRGIYVIPPTSELDLCLVVLSEFSTRRLLTVIAAFTDV